ncbi:MAG: DNA polymerase III subunit delta [Calditrichaeota bacterium]|nr:DNA polymerase III subunit delta [Calditrichota bacterium]
MKTARKTSHSYKETLAEIQQGNVRPGYFVFGEEPYLMDHLLEQLALKFLGEPQREINYFLRYAPDTPMEEVVALLTGGGLFSSKKLVVYKDVQQLRTQKFQHFLHYMDHPPADLCLVLVARTGAPSRKFQPLMEKFFTVEIQTPGTDELMAFIQGEFRRLGKRVDTPAVQTLLYHVGERLHDLQMEIVQIANYFQEKDVITAEDVEQIVGIHINQTVFDLTRLIAQRDQEKALFTMRNLLAKGESPQSILYFLIRHFMMLWKIHGYYKSGIRDDREIQERLKLYRSHYQAYKQQVSHWTFGKIIRAFQKIKWADQQLKSSQMPPDLILDILVLQLIN